MKEGLIYSAIALIALISLTVLVILSSRSFGRFNGNKKYTPIPSAKQSIRDIPDKIYLQIGDDTPNDVSFKDLDEVTWCQDRINDNNIEYIRVKKKNQNYMTESEWKEYFKK